MNAAYLDASALVKLLRREAETDALWDALSRWPVRVSSELLAVELRGTARRLGGAATLERAEAALATVDLVVLTEAIRDRAGATFTPALRTLDAIHVATALALREELAVVIAYDAVLCAAASAEGLETLTPR